METAIADTEPSPTPLSPLQALTQPSLFSHHQATSPLAGDPPSAATVDPTPTAYPSLEVLIDQFNARQKTTATHAAPSLKVHGRSTIAVDDATNKPRHEALQAIIATHSWYTLLAYTRSHILTGGGGAPETAASLYQLWYYRVMALFRLKLYDHARQELDRLAPLISDASDAATDFAFGLATYRAACPALHGDHTESLDRFYSLLSSATVDRAVWLRMNIANVLLALKDFPCAISVVESCLPDVTGGSLEVSVLCLLARIFMTVGNVAAAKRTFSRIEQTLRNRNSADINGTEVNQTAHDTLMMNRATLAIGNGDWHAAATILTTLVTASPGNATAANNLCVCLLYMGRLPEAISLLESTVFTVAPSSAGVCDHVLFNLTTLYELGSEQGMEKKQRIVDNLFAHAGDSLIFEHFKL